ncbi:MAG TPA: hypothetical protein VN031_03935 [Candidatus Microsaccharimonas sp.]|nr:hypothetical protein [Candidatus Microsaccharimonas sp.]
MAKVSTKKRTNTRRARATQKTTPRKTTTRSASVADSLQPSTTPRGRWQRVPKSERPVRPRLPGIFKLAKQSYRLVVMNWKLIAGITLVYGVLNIVLVHSLNGGLSASDIRTQLDQLSQGGWNHIASGLGVFMLLLSSSNRSTTSDAASVYQTFLLIISSLALVWAYRQFLSDKQVPLRIRDGFYRGMYPLVPVILVLLVIVVQLIPMLIGGVLFTTVISNGIAVSGLQIAFWAIPFLVLFFISLRMISASIFALYIVSLPDMTPMRALRSARDLVRFRRLAVFARLIALPLILLVGLAILMLPFILLATALTQWVFFVLSMAVLPIAHAYLYTLYRELLNE